MFADIVNVVNPEAGTVTRKTRIRPVGTQQRHRTVDSMPEYLSRFEVERYLHSALLGELT